MNFYRMIWSMAAALVFLAAPLGSAAMAEDLIVEHSPSAGHYATIQAAIDHAASVLSNPGNTTSFRVVVKADPVAYSGPITPISNVPIVGSSTSGTFIAGSGSGTLINLDSVTSVTIRNLTFRTAAVGVSISNCSAISISNNVFQLGTSGVAVSVSNSPSTSIINNTFVGNATGIATNTDTPIINDIFYNNTNAITTQVSLTQLSYSFFNSNLNVVSDLGLHSIPSAQVPNQNPLFVDVANRDYHLQAGSAARGSGSPNYPNSFDSSSSDMGAYGGPFADTQVPAVTGFFSQSTGTDSMSLRWDASPSLSVTAYRVYYGTASGNYNGTQAAEGASPITVSAPTTTATLGGLSLPPPATPSAPTLTVLIPIDRGLSVMWSSVSGATGYRVYYSTTNFTSTLPSTFAMIEDGNITSYTIPGLTNGTTYFVAVSAVAQNKVYAALTAVVNAAVASAPGGSNESLYSAETSQGVGPTVEGPISVTVGESPEAFDAFPDFKIGTGCFIATAAYGSYLAPQVQLLRTFRDSFLMTNAPGRAFVAWYYRYGPHAAGCIDAHPWLKVPVRLALLPLLALAAFLIYTPPAVQGALLLFAVSLAAAIYLKTRRRVPVQSGGAPE